LTLIYLAITCAAFQVAAVFLAGVRQRHISNFEDLPRRDLERFPKVSIVVPACNEGETIGPALKTLSALDYPDLELIVVNDRSTDQTGAVIDQAAALDPRIIAVHNEELPEGWLGKVHALHLGQKASSGDWILFTDADVHLAPDALKRTVGYAQSEGLDHLPVCPDLSGRSALANGCIANFHMHLMFLVSPAAVYDPNKPDGVGVGGFNLVRRATLEASHGFEWLRLEVADDFALGALLKAAGGRCQLVYGNAIAQVEWYPSMGAMIRGFEKNAYGILAHYSPLKAVVKLVAMGAPVVLPVAALPWTAWHPLGWVAALMPLTACWVVGWFMARRIGWPYHRFVLAPLTTPMLWFSLLNGLLKTWQRGGIDWRGTLYSIDELRAAQRIKL